MAKGETTIQSAPTTPAPSAGESASQLAQARLQYDPQIAQMEQDLASRFYPQQANLQAALYQQYAPQMAGIQQQLRQQYSPTQAALTESLAQQGIQRLQSPYGETPQEAAATEMIRQREADRLSRMMQTRANVGGNLYGGRSIEAENQALSQMGQAFAQQDITRRQQGAQTALQYAMPSIQQLYPQVTFPGTAQTQAPVQTPVTPDANALYNAMFQASQPQNYQTTANKGMSLGPFGQWGSY